MKKKLYQWHRKASLIIAIPVLLWAVSGFMHPIMTTIRPKVVTQGLSTIPADSSKIKIPLQIALLKNHIDSFATVRLVHIDSNWFYQLQKKYGEEPVYIATMNGKILTAGDWLYAQYLAMQFLEGQQKPALPKDQPTMITQVAMAMPMHGNTHDCCDAATDCVLNGKKGSKVSDASRITSFNSEYKSINRLLPVYKVSFEREDGIRIYVETTQDRFAFAMDNKRRVFDKIFTLVHTWAWLNFLGKGKLVIEFLLVSLAFVTTCMGLYIFFTSKSKALKGNELIKARRSHRYTSVAISLFTLMFTFSGAYHALSKLKEDKRDQFFVSPAFATKSADLNFSQLQHIIKNTIINIVLIRMDNRNYWRVISPAQKENNQYTAKDIMKNAGISLPAINYIATDNNSILPDGELKYAKYLAGCFSKYNESTIVSAIPVTSFSNEYNFADKRLPVWKISYASGNNQQRFYVEPSTGKLSKKIDDSDLAEGYSFAFFHKHEFMAWGGKPIKDFSTMFWALAQIVMVVVGLVFYFTWLKRK